MLDAATSTAVASSISPNSLNWLLGGGAALAAFVASVMGDEQSERLKNGAVGGVVGTSIGGLAGLIKGQPDLVILGFFGSVLGATAGWVVYFMLSLLAPNPKSRTVLDFMTGGLKAVKDSLYVDSPTTIIPALNSWCDNFMSMARKAQAGLLNMPQDPTWPLYAKGAIASWLTTVVDTFSLVFRTLAKKPEYQSRVTIIVYGMAAGKITGKHWIHYEGQLIQYRTNQAFDDSSIGYKVLTRQSQYDSPYFTTSKTAQDTGQRRADDPAYRPFITFRLNDSAILALDWPETLDGGENDPYVKAAREFFNRDLSPLIAEVLDKWPTPLSAVVDLEPLTANVQAAPTTAASTTTAAPSR
ncbi:MAG: hypothetical protein ACLP59_31000 [Bryobacteraceae bacterium]